jgi:hypothetical protein
MSTNDRPVDLDAEQRLAAAAADRCSHCGSPRTDDPSIPALPARYRLLPLDAATAPPEVSARLRELGASPYWPWIWLRTVGPIDPGQPVRLLADGACLTHVKPPDPGPPERLLAEGVGLTRTEYVWRRFEDRRWRGFTLDLFGMHFVEPDELPPDCEAFWLEADVDPNALAPPRIELALELWSVRTRYHDSPLYAEVGARPGTARRGQIVGYEQRYSDADEKSARQGLKLLLAQRWWGRRPESREAARLSVCEATATIKARGEVVNRPNLAREMGLTLSGLDKKRRRADIRLDQLKATPLPDLRAGRIKGN